MIRQLVTRYLAAAALAAIAAAPGFALNQDAKPEVAVRTPVEVPVRIAVEAPMHVVGYTVRTTNAAEATGDGAIPKLWTRFFQENLGAQIPHRVGQSLIVVYSDYASDQNGEYTYLLGAPVDSVDSLEGLPKGLTVRTIPAGSYAVITTRRGRPQEIISAAWMRIWRMPETELGGRRSFVMDYERYDDFTDPNNMQVGIHLGIVPAAK